VKDPENRAVVQLNGDVITDIVEKPQNPPRDAWCSVGGYCVEKDDLRYLDDIALSPRGELELPDFILRLVQDSEVRAKTIERFWLPITYSWDVLQAALFLWEEPERARDSKDPFTSERTCTSTGPRACLAPWRSVPARASRLPPSSSGPFSSTES
jgi:dTDP-glucose pyrophosphorylase